MNRAKLLSLIINKWPVKVLSLTAAILISVFYRMTTLETRFFTVPLLIESSDTLVPAVTFAGSVRVSLRGENDEIHSILEEDIEAYIDIGKYTNEGSYRVPVQIRKKGSALGVEPLEISVLPIDIPMVLEQKITRSIQVFPVFSGSVAEGFELIYQTLIPGNVVVEGPRSILTSFTGFNTEPIILDRRYENFTSIISISNNNPLLSIHGNMMLEFHGYINPIIRNDVYRTEERREEIIEIVNNETDESGEEPEDEEEIIPDITSRGDDD